MRKLLNVAMVLLLGCSAAFAQWKPVGENIKTRWASKIKPDTVWREYPRPQMVRKDWQNLNGLWDYTHRPKPRPNKPKPHPTNWKGKILVPFAVESSLSGVGRIHPPWEELWYHREFEVKKGDDRILLHFEAVDYKCEVWINDKSVGTHKGGHIPFTFDITDAAVDGKNIIKVKVIDATAAFQLRGKQARRPGGIFYTRVSGIWQTVWLEKVPKTYIKRIKIDTKINPGKVIVKTFVGGDADKADGVKITARFKGKKVASVKGKLDETVLTIKDAKLWTPNTPNLYDLEVELLDGRKTIDSVDSYAGIRTVGRKKDAEGHWRFTLNDKIIFHLGLLDQGWWPDGLLTPPCDEAMNWDLDFMKEAGFNMVRCHIKVCPRRYYTYCDRIGLLVWQDQVSGPPHPPWKRFQNPPVDIEWPDDKHEQWMYELKMMMDYFHNNPSIVSWIPFNEAWGQHRSMEVGKWTVEYDPSRLVNIASGGNFWEVGHIADAHSYPHPKFPLKDSRVKDYIKVVGEFGGHGYNVDDKHQWNPKAKKWSYGPMPKEQAELFRRYKKSMGMLMDLKKKGVAGGVYTQVTDIEVEINGLITYDREKIKIPAEELKKICMPFYE